MGKNLFAAFMGILFLSVNVCADTKVFCVNGKYDVNAPLSDIPRKDLNATIKGILEIDSKAQISAPSFFWVPYGPEPHPLMVHMCITVTSSKDIRDVISNEHAINERSEKK